MKWWPSLRRSMNSSLACTFRTTPSNALHQVAGVTSEKLSFLTRNETVIDLLRHLPYLRAHSHKDPILIYNGCACIDYSNESFVQEMSFFIDPPNDSPHERVTACIEPHMVTLARAHPPTAGFYIFCNTEDGRLELADMTDGSSRKRNAKEFFIMLKAEYRTLDVVPIDPFEIRSADGGMSDRVAEVKEVYAKHTVGSLDGFAKRTARKRSSNCGILYGWGQSLHAVV